MIIWIDARFLSNDFDLCVVPVMVLASLVNGKLESHLQVLLDYNRLNCIMDEYSIVNRE